MKLDKAVSAAKNLKIYTEWSKKAKKWSKRKKRLKWIPRIYRKRKHLGNIVYSVMYLTTRKD